MRMGKHGTFSFVKAAVWARAGVWLGRALVSHRWIAVEVVA